MKYYNFRHALRKLNCYKGCFQPGKINSKINIKEVNDLNFERVKSFLDFDPTWQNSNESISTDHFKIFVASCDSILVGYLVINKACRIIQIGVDVNYRREGIASALIDHSISDNFKELSIINVDSNNIGLDKLLTSRGMIKYLEQYEFILKL